MGMYDEPLDGSHGPYGTSHGRPHGKKYGDRRRGQPRDSHRPTKPCEWCGQSLPTVKYHLRICPDCRKNSISDFIKSVRR